MRKVILALIITTLFAVPAFCADLSTIKTVAVISNTTQQVTNLTGTITPGQYRVVGWSVSPKTPAASAVYAALYDGKDNATSFGNDTALSNTIFAEEYGVANTTVQHVFAYPRAISSGVTLVQSANSTVVIEYAR